MTATDTRTLPDHGSYARYTIHACRCDDCREASNAYNRDRDRQIAYGRWRPFADAAPVRAHLKLLAAAGIGPSRIPGLAGVPVIAVTRLLYRNPPILRIKTATAEAILALRPDRALQSERALTASLGSARRLQSLAAVGFPLSHAPRLLGLSDRTTRHAMSHDRLFASTAWTIAEAYERLKDQDPAGHGVSAQASAYARGHAARQGWPRPEQWDGEIDNPDADPQAWVRNELAPRSVEDIVVEAEELRAEHDLSWEAIAERLGIRRDTLHTYRGRVRDRVEARAVASVPCRDQPEPTP